jgi:hypothetical protein
MSLICLDCTKWFELEPFEFFLDCPNCLAQFRSDELLHECQECGFEVEGYERPYECPACGGDELIEAIPPEIDQETSKSISEWLEDKLSLTELRASIRNTDEVLSHLESIRQEAVLSNNGIEPSSPEFDDLVARLERTCHFLDVARGIVIKVEDIAAVAFVWQVLVENCDWFDEEFNFCPKEWELFEINAAEKVRQLQVRSEPEIRLFVHRFKDFFPDLSKIEKLGNFNF